MAVQRGVKSRLAEIFMLYIAAKIARKNGFFYSNFYN